MEDGLKIENRPGWSRALWRHAAVSQVAALVLGGESFAKALRQASNMHFADGDGMMRKASNRSLRRWYSGFQKKGIEALFDPPRSRKTTGLSEDFISFLQIEKEQDHDASIPEVIARAKERSIIGNIDEVDRTTVYRAALRLNLPILRRKSNEATTMRPFAFEHRMMMVLCDGKKFRAGIHARKRTAIMFIDDSSRKILGCAVGPEETKELFLKVLYQVLSKYGRFSAAFLDNGSGFKSLDAMKVFANLKIPLIYGTKGYAEGHGKIERFNSTITNDLLRGLRKPGVDPKCSALDMRLNHYIKERYNVRYNDGVEAIPNEFFSNDTRPLDFFGSDQELRRAFVITEDRKVKRDNVLRYRGGAYEVPLGYTGRRITMYRDILDDKVYMMHEGKQLTLAPPDLSVNSREKRPGIKKTKQTRGIINTAANMHFERDFAPIVDCDGGFPKPHPKTED